MSKDTLQTELTQLDKDIVHQYLSLLEKVKETKNGSDEKADDFHDEHFYHFSEYRFWGRELYFAEQGGIRLLCEIALSVEIYWIVDVYGFIGPPHLRKRFAMNEAVEYVPLLFELIKYDPGQYDCWLSLFQNCIEIDEVKEILWKDDYYDIVTVDRQDCYRYSVAILLCLSVEYDIVDGIMACRNKGGDVIDYLMKVCKIAENPQVMCDTIMTLVNLSLIPEYMDVLMSRGLLEFLDWFFEIHPDIFNELISFLDDEQEEAWASLSHFFPICFSFLPRVQLIGLIYMANISERPIERVLIEESGVLPYLLVNTWDTENALKLTLMEKLLKNCDASLLEPPPLSFLVQIEILKNIDQLDLTNVPPALLDQYPVLIHAKKMNKM